MSGIPFDLYNPRPEHKQLRETVSKWAEAYVDPQADEADEHEKFNEPLFRRLATELGLFGVTVSEEDGGLGLDAVALTIICEELSRFDPAFALSYLAHEILFVNNFYFSSNARQREKYLSKVIDGTWIAGMAMSEPGAGTDVLGMTTHAQRDGECGHPADVLAEVAVEEVQCNLHFPSLWSCACASRKELSAKIPSHGTAKTVGRMGAAEPRMGRLIFRDGPTTE
jgi:hypothetical protein